MQRLLITAARLFDGTGRGPLRPGALLVDGDRIVAVAERLDAPHGAERIDLGDATIVPGLVDCHVHLSDGGGADPSADDADPLTLRALRMADRARRTLAAGFTTVRDVGGRDHVEFDVRRAAIDGAVAAPRLMLAGKIVSAPTPGATTWRGMYREASDAAGIAAAVREQIEAGADVIKVMATGAVLSPGSERPDDAQYSTEQLRVAIDEAHRHGRRVAVHAHGIEGIRRALEAGADTIEHGTHLHEDRAVARRMAERGVHLVPTLKALARIAEPEAPGIPADMVAKARERRADRDATFRVALDEGVPIAFGTDAATPFNRHGENAEELGIMVALGMSALDALRSATSEAARAIGRDDLGLLAAGRLADVAAWEGDATRDVELVRRPPALVLLGGRRVV